jgi:hypothetical protein
MSNAEHAKNATSAEIEPTGPASQQAQPEGLEEALDGTTQARFLRDLVERGEVVPKGKALPAGATHELEVDDGHQILHRRRFSTY